jgi:hypothetical protein
MVIMMKEKKLAKSRSIKVLDYAMSGSSSAAAANCERFVESLGLKTLFPALMAKVFSSSFREMVRAHELIANPFVALKKVEYSGV